jgi:hypothetical protein
MQFTGKLEWQMSASRNPSRSLARKKSTGSAPSRRYNHRSFRQSNRAPLPGSSHHPLHDFSLAAVHSRPTA